MYRRFLKCTFDVFFAVILLLLLLPLLVLLGVATLLANRGHGMLFVQKRQGRNGEVFNTIKFKTMRDPKDIHTCDQSNHQRLTRFGQFMRSASLDELPQLVNIIKGDMSFIGPRPLLVKYFPLYSDTQRRRFEIKPGITGWAQVNGRNSISWTKKFELDIWYVDHYSPALDCRILLMTLKTILSRKGIESDGNEEFNGN
jgi:lipopolysaccharide/colanic/teichoic acid biosynthesis glycosyltransferase